MITSLNNGNVYRWNTMQAMPACPYVTQGASMQSRTPPWTLLQTERTSESSHMPRRCKHNASTLGHLVCVRRCKNGVDQAEGCNTELHLNSSYGETKRGEYVPECLVFYSLLTLAMLCTLCLQLSFPLSLLLSLMLPPLLSLGWLLLQGQRHSQSQTKAQSQAKKVMGTFRQKA